MRIILLLSILVSLYSCTDTNDRGQKVVRVKWTEDNRIFIRTVDTAHRVGDTLYVIATGSELSGKKSYAVIVN